MYNEEGMLHTRALVFHSVAVVTRQTLIAVPASRVVNTLQTLASSPAIT